MKITTKESLKIVKTILFISMFLYIANYISRYINILQYGYMPWQIDNSQHHLYEFSNYIINYWYNNLPVQNLSKINLIYIKGFILSLIITFFLIVSIFLYIKASFMNKNSMQKPHGNAKFATLIDIKNSDLYHKNDGIPSVILGKFDNKLLKFKQNKFVSLVAPTRAGKGVGIVIPNLLYWSSSLVCLDIKSENFDKTSGFRATFTKVFKFDPFSEYTHRYNPLTYINKNPLKTISDIQTIARILWPFNEKDPIWNDSSCNLFQGLILYILDQQLYIIHDLTMFNVFKLASEIGILEEKAWNDLKDKSKFLTARTLMSLNSYFNLPQETKTSVLGNFNSQMQIFSNPSVVAATSSDDFDLENIRKQKISIYICIAPNKLSQASKLLNIFFSQLIQVNTEELPEQNSALNQTVLIVLDEFSALGKIDIIQSAISYIAGYNLRLLLIYQSQSQLSAIYGEEVARNIITNCGCQIIFTPREQKDAEDYSKMLGNTTINIENYSYNQGSKESNGKNISISQQERPLMLDQELKQMGKDTQIIIIEDCKPIKSEKIKYYTDKFFIAKLLTTVSISKLNIKNEWLGMSKFIHNKFK